MGPDGSGNFETIDVEQDYADTCDRSFCTCTTHADFFNMANQRLDEAAEILAALEAIKIEENADDYVPTAEDLEDEEFFETEIDETSTSVSSNTNTQINGLDLQSTLTQLLECNIGPDIDGNYYTQVITVIDYQLLCATGGNSELCDCDTDNTFGYDDLGDREVN